MRFTLQILLISILAAIAEFFLPWWSIAVAAFFVGLAARQRPARTFLMGFLGIFLFWAIAGLISDIANGHILSNRIGELFFIHGYVFIGVSAIVGGLVGGFSAWAGALLRKPKQNIPLVDH